MPNRAFQIATNKNLSGWNARFSTSLVGVCSLFIATTSDKRVSARGAFLLSIVGVSEEFFGVVWGWLSALGLS